MRILLIGEFSNVHWSLGTALRKQGHDVTIVSDGNNWREYPCDVQLRRKSKSKPHTAIYILKIIYHLLFKWHGYDVVQLIHPTLFLELRAHRLQKIYDYLRRRNKKIFILAAGDDYQYVYDSYVRRRLRYCDYYTSEREIENSYNKKLVQEFLHTEKKDVCLHVADTCNGIIAVLYEYYVAYADGYDTKTAYIPLPIEIENDKKSDTAQTYPIRLFIGMDRRRDAIKGTDILYRVAMQLKERYPDKCEVIKTESLPYKEYIKIMSACDMLLDQIYSYTPAMNALKAMSIGIAVASGGEEEHYELIKEKELRPIINLIPEEKDIYEKLEEIILQPETLSKLKHDGVKYIQKHHDSLKVAQQYIDFWNSK